MSKFKVGDMVQSTSLPDSGIGVVYEVTEQVVRVKFPDYGKCSERPEDLRLVADDGPVRTETVTTRRIVPGVYGRLEVSTVEQVDLNEGFLMINIDGDMPSPWTATELDDLAMVASQLAEALRDA